MSTDGGPPRPTADAVSLHTLAEDDTYVAQEQEDADYALALALEEEDARVVNNPHNRDVDGVAHFEAAGEVTSDDLATSPYSDEPHHDNVETDRLSALPPYRDDPEAPLNDEDESEDHMQARLSVSQRFWGSTQLLRAFVSRFRALRAKPRKIIPCSVVSVVVYLLIISGVIWWAIIAVRKPTSSSKEAAFKKSGSENYHLELPKLYPQLEASASADCRRAWEKHAENLYCHEGILTSAWDKGEASEVKRTGYDPWAYSELSCIGWCEEAIYRMVEPLTSACHRRTDRFDLEEYQRRQYKYFDIKEIQEGPRYVATALKARYNRLCSKPSHYETQSGWGTYTAELWMHWGILDGKDAAANTGDLPKFLEATKDKKTIEGGRRTGSVRLVKGELQYDVKVPTRKVGPGAGETDCGYGIESWLERMMRSFEYGAVMDPKSGFPYVLKDFDGMIQDAIKRCDPFEVSQRLRRVHTIWKGYGWWCGDVPCREDEPTPEEVLKLFQGLRNDDWPLPDLRKQMKRESAPMGALQALHDGMANMPCSIWFNENDLKRHIIPFDHRVRTLCGVECRNAVDRMQWRHGDEFAVAAQSLPMPNVFQTWDLARAQVNKTCSGLAFDDVILPESCFVAPGYAALGHAEWVLDDKPPTKLAILSAYGSALENLVANPPEFIPDPGGNMYLRRIDPRRMRESACNGCAGELLIGGEHDHRSRVEEFLNDKTTDGREYTRVAKMFFTTCSKLGGHELSEAELKKLWMETGLDRFD